jgi:hypothetical protein
VASRSTVSFNSNVAADRLDSIDCRRLRLSADLQRLRGRSERFALTSTSSTAGKRQSLLASRAPAGIQVLGKQLKEVWQHANADEGALRRLYWERCRVFNPELGSKDVETAVQTVIEYQRPSSAIDLLSTGLHQSKRISTDSLIAPLEALLLLPAEKTKSQFGQMVT